jgi:hypothetical protein
MKGAQTGKEEEKLFAGSLITYARCLASQQRKDRLFSKQNWNIHMQKNELQFRPFTLYKN